MHMVSITNLLQCLQAVLSSCFAAHVLAIVLVIIPGVNSALLERVATLRIFIELKRKHAPQFFGSDT